MRRTLVSAMAVISLGLGGLMLGCEDTVSKHSETTTRSDGTQVKKEEKVTRNADGTTTKTQSVDVDKPDNDKDHDVKVKIDTK